MGQDGKLPPVLVMETLGRRLLLRRASPTMQDKLEYGAMENCQRLSGECFVQFNNLMCRDMYKRVIREMCSSFLTTRGNGL